MPADGETRHPLRMRQPGQISKPNLAESLKETGRGSGSALDENAQAGLGERRDFGGREGDPPLARKAFCYDSDDARHSTSDVFVARPARAAVRLKFYTQRSRLGVRRV